MLKHHPNSPFVVREDALPRVLDVFANNIQKYKGFYYTDDNVCVLWNYILVSDPHDMRRILGENIYKGPHPDFNGVSIDFAVFRQLKDCLEFVGANNNERIKHVLFIRDGNPRLYPIGQILQGVGK